MIERRSTLPWGAGLVLGAMAAAAAVIGAPQVSDAQSVRDLFQKVTPSVVVIRAKGRDVTGGGETTFTETGSGVLVSRDGKVMTAAHVVHAMDTVAVEFLGGETVNARVVASEPAADLSLLQLDRVPPTATVSPMADSDKVQVGDQVVIVGAPYGLSYSLSVGYISARWAPNTVYRTMPLAEFFQTDATINTGNSGGPMFTMNGEVAGIVSHNISKGGGSEGLGFVVTMNTAKQLLLEKKSFWSGLEGVVLSDRVADLLNPPNRASGFIVKTVAKVAWRPHRPARQHHVGADRRSGHPDRRCHHHDGQRHLGVVAEPCEDSRQPEFAAAGRRAQGHDPAGRPGPGPDRQGPVNAGATAAGP
jgi:S1-C subfamily serine protease